MNTNIRAFHEQKASRNAEAKGNGAYAVLDSNEGLVSVDMFLGHDAEVRHQTLSLSGSNGKPFGTVIVRKGNANLTLYVLPDELDTAIKMRDALNAAIAYASGEPQN